MSFSSSRARRPFAEARQSVEHTGDGVNGSAGVPSTHATAEEEQADCKFNETAPMSSPYYAPPLPLHGDGGAWTTITTGVAAATATATQNFAADAVAAEEPICGESSDGCDRPHPSQRTGRGRGHSSDAGSPACAAPSLSVTPQGKRVSTAEVSARKGPLDYPSPPSESAASAVAPLSALAQWPPSISQNRGVREGDAVIAKKQRGGEKHRRWHPHKHADSYNSGDGAAHRRSHRQRRHQRNLSDTHHSAGSLGFDGMHPSAVNYRPSAVPSSQASTSAATDATQVTVDSFGYPAYHPLFRHAGGLSERGVLTDGAVTAAAIEGSSVPSRQVVSLASHDCGPVNATGGGSGGAMRGGARVPTGGGSSGPGKATLPVPITTDVPWELRNSGDQNITKTFDFLSKRYFWFLVEYALRVTLIAMLVPAALINASLPHTPFTSTTFALTSVVVATGTNFGQTSLFFVQYIKAGFIWLPLATICVALQLNHYLAVWFIVYVGVLFLMAVFTEKTTRRICLLLFNICMINLLSDNESLLFPTRVLADWALGAAFALCATLLPYPLLATHLSARLTSSMFESTATCFTGILSCFWAPSNTERSMAMVRIRSIVRTLDHLIEKFDTNDAYTFYEFLLYETSERREVRKEKVKLVVKLVMNLRAMERVINMVQENPQVMDQSDRCKLLQNHLSGSMDDLSRSMEALLWSISSAKRYDGLRAIRGYFDEVGRSIKHLQNEFDVARRVLFYERQEAITLHNGRMEEFVPLMTFFLFSIVNFWTTLQEFGTFIDRNSPVDDWKLTLAAVWKALLEPFVDNGDLIRRICVRRGEPEVRVVIEAAKVSVAMLISVIFFYYVDSQSLLLSGPTIIAFVSGTNPVEAVKAGADRLSGTMIGSVLGFFAATLCRTAADRVIALCVITFVMTFFRPGQKFGAICMYCNFVAVSSLAPTQQTAEGTISRIQQNTFAIFIYCFISVVVFPVSPNRVLFQKRLQVMYGLNKTVQKLVALFEEASHRYEETLTELQDGLKGDGDVIAITPSTASTFIDAGQAPRPSEVCAVTVDVALKEATARKAMKSCEGRRPQGIVMTGAFTMAPEDIVVGRIFSDIFATLDLMKTTAAIMPLAADEFEIIPHEYPLRASGDVHAALYRLCALVYVMTCSWKAMREKGYFTTDMLHILHNLTPIVRDIGCCFDRVVHIMDFYIRFPSSGLSSELTKGVMQFRALGMELSVRKERGLIAVIRQTIAAQLMRERETAAAEAGERKDNDGRHHQQLAHQAKDVREQARKRSSRRHHRDESSHLRRRACRAEGRGPNQVETSHMSRHSTQSGYGDPSSGIASLTPEKPLSHPSGAGEARADALSPEGQNAQDALPPYTAAATTNQEGDSLYSPVQRPATTSNASAAAADPPHSPSPAAAPQVWSDKRQESSRNVRGSEDDGFADGRTSVASSEEMRPRGTHAMSNATRIFDPNVFGPPAPVRPPMPVAPQRTPSAVSAHRENGRDCASVHSAPLPSPDRPQTLTPYQRSLQDDRRSPRTLQGSTPRQTLSALQRIDKLRGHLRGIQRQSSREERRTLPTHFSFSCPNLVALSPTSSASLTVPTSGRHHHHHHVKASPQHRSQRRRHRPRSSSDTPLEEDPENVRAHQPAGHVCGPLVGRSKALIDTEASTAAAEQRSAVSHYVDADVPSLSESQKVPEVPQAFASSAEGLKHGSADRITLNQSSSDGTESSVRRLQRGSRKKRSGHSSTFSSRSSSSSAGAAASSHSSDSRSHSSSTTSGSNGKDGEEASLIRYNDSFTTPITVQDAEGLHSFTLSLEMFGKELRRTLYGFEEMLQRL